MPLYHYLCMTCPTVFFCDKKPTKSGLLNGATIIGTCRNNRRSIKRNESRLVKCCVQNRAGPSGDPGKYRSRRRCFPLNTTSALHGRNLFWWSLRFWYLQTTLLCQLQQLATSHPSLSRRSLLFTHHTFCGNRKMEETRMVPIVEKS
jgi:hypothetical protein